MKKRLPIIAKVFLITGILFFSIFEITLNKPSTLKIESIDQRLSTDSTLKIACYQKGIIPKPPVKMAGYGNRSKFNAIHDSLYTKVILLQKGDMTIAFVTMDLLIISPEISSEVIIELQKMGITGVYFSASHSHSSFGGWGNSFLGNFILGGRDKTVLNNLISSAVQGVKMSLAKLQLVKQISFNKRAFKSVKNRVSKERNVDCNLRNLIFKTVEGKSISILSTDVHPTILGHHQDTLSNDYPGELCKQDTSDFTMFLAGIMGSLSPIVRTENSDFKKIKNYANIQLRGNILENRKLTKNILSFTNYKLPEIELSAQITENLKLRPYVFKLLLGSSEPKLYSLRVGEALFVALPVELSGEFYNELEQLAKSKDLFLMLTTFNGEYLGYATPSGHFHSDHMETREMNWLGKYGGDNFNNLVRKIIEKQ